MLSVSLPAHRAFSFKTWALWSVICFIFAFASVPFLITLQGDLLAETLSEFPYPPEVIMTINGGINGILSIVLGGLGLLMASRIGLGLPFIENAVKKTSIPYNVMAFVAIGITTGLVASLWTIIVDAVLFSQPVTNILEPPGVDLRGIRPPFWQGFLAAFSAGIIEETLFRLFGLTFLMWIGTRISKTESGHPSVIVFIVANLIIAIGFGLSHIGNLALFDIEPTFNIIIRILELNSGMALIFGWVYWRFGLETAVIAHITVDIMLQGVGTFASNADTNIEALLVYLVAHVILLAVAGLLWFISSKQNSTYKTS